MAAFNPGQSPPPVMIPIRGFLSIFSASSHDHVLTDTLVGYEVCVKRHFEEDPFRSEVP
jgi:hypothetical protein